MKCLVVDDDLLVCEQIANYCEEQKSIEYCVKVNSGLNAMSLINAHQFDLIFLDLHLPDFSGRELIKLIPSETNIVVISSESDFAVEAFRYNVKAYLLKPIQPADFYKALNKVAPSTKSDSSVFVKDGNRLIRIELAELCFVKSESNYSNFQLTSKRILSLNKLSELEEKLPSNFLRVHRSYIVNTDFIDGLEGRSILIREHQIPVSESYYNKLQQHINQL